MKNKKILIAQLAIASAALIATVASTTVALYVKSADSTGSYGEISLRSYFHSGTGESVEDAYVITRPQHLYNLSRLQSLGVFKTKTYFKLGTTDLDPNGLVPMCYGPDNVTPVPFLDMSSSNYSSLPINAIGSESIPFYGEFDGQGVEIKGLNVYADPEDAGLFGYTGHGSKITNLFLDDITINALGYTAGYADLYASDSTLASGVSIAVKKTPSAASTTTFYYNSTNSNVYSSYDAEDYFGGDNTAIPSAADSPVITASWPNDGLHNYSLLPSNKLITITNEKDISINFGNLFKMFKDEKAGDAPKYPLQAASSVAIIASRTDTDGLDHSKVLLTLEFNLTLPSSTSNNVSVDIRLGSTHGNNIGLIAGHCDGTIRDCYVHNGKYNINNNAGGSVSGTFNSMPNGSGFGLIGLVGNSVHDIAAEKSDSSTKTGKDIGVLDITTIYDDIVGNTTFPSPKQTLEGKNGIKYYPAAGTKYKDYLRYLNNDDDYYVTKDNNYVSFRGDQVVWTPELGVFTIVTDYANPGIEATVDSGFLDSNPTSTIHKESSSVDYLYYATGEYNAEFAEEHDLSFADYRDSLETTTPSQLLVGHHLPEPGELTSESFAEREMTQNYIFRFQLQSAIREENKKLYFSDVDVDTAGGSFLSSYFYYKLRDQNNQPIKINDAKAGVMLRDFLGHEISSFSASITTPDLSWATGTSEALKPRMYCLDNSERNYPASNMINFEIKTDVANVTVVAAPNEENKSAALGVYKTDVDGAHPTVGSYKYIPKSFESPDYAFFMPKEDNLAYFDYGLDSEGTGVVGNYASADGDIVAATYQTNATVPSNYVTGEPKPITGMPRLYVHTFTLTKGHYCLGAATGANSDAGSGKQTVPKIYYVCAQGQTDGQLQFDSNTFASADVVENVDFIKVSKYTYNSSTKTTTTNITTGPDAAWSAESTLLQHLRCYISLLKSDRSKFDAGPVDLSFIYDDENDIFVIDTDTSDDYDYIKRLTVSNYGVTMNSGDLTGLTNLTVSLLNLEDSTAARIIYPKS